MSIPVDSPPVQFRSIIALPTETELRNMVLDVDQNDNGMIEFNEFLQMMSKKMREGDSEDELKEAFKWVYELEDWIARPKLCNDSQRFIHIAAHKRDLS